MTFTSKVLFACVTPVIIGAFSIYNWLVFWQTDSLVAGTLGLMSAYAVSAVAVLRLLIPIGGKDKFDEYTFFVHKNIFAALVISIVAWGGSLVWSACMWRDLIGRPVYVGSLQDAIKKGENDYSSLPDADGLAQSFSWFPNRKEVPVLLTRSSRRLLEANKPDLFRQFQAKFLSSLEKYDGTPEHYCELPSETARYDGLLFLVSVASDAYVPANNDDIDRVIGKLKPYVETLRRCRPNSLRAAVRLLQADDMMEEWRMEAGAPAQLDVKKRISDLEKKINETADERELLAFWQSHEAQEFLDFKAYRDLVQVSRASSAADVEIAINSARRNYETLLLLRQNSLRTGDIIWNRPPHKLDIFHAFMLASSLDTLAASDTKRLFKDRSEVFQSIQDLANVKAFEAFRSPKGWYEGTPLDGGLNGRGLKDKMSIWLKEDW